MRNEYSGSHLEAGICHAECPSDEEESIGFYYGTGQEAIEVQCHGIPL